jgi:hypothetical protein
MEVLGKTLACYTEPSKQIDAKKLTTTTKSFTPNQVMG